jgi:hypothetical protein
MEEESGLFSSAAPIVINSSGFLFGEKAVSQ